ncbi:DUF305 domain-containing protein [Microbispora sp. RL4-1S]|uniref:DUF305 domain-containing protein n=1 Tax=Microbispora oryzae TaxID=2806554 RepID=A0A940WSD7_9ACTN|nr:DUF305 domain-containing protein [Microbispora oryzae]MBP2706179.1 DUF305 domain-containing protein [Microbispora oryzae]
MTSIRRRAVAVVLAVTVTVAVTVAVVVTGAAVFGGPADDSADAGFARDMQVHHAQAVRMAMIVRDRTSDEEVRTLAYDIALTQQQQIGQMFAWLDQWGLPQTSLAPPMAWAAQGHAAMNHTGAAMPGMATSAQLQRLGEARDRAAETLFLQLMIAHHRGGVDMARAVLRSGDDGRVRRLAGAIVTAQAAEISLMERMLSAREAGQGARQETGRENTHGGGVSHG